MSVNSIFAGSTPNSRDAIRQQYLNYLALEIANQTKNLNANKLFRANGTTGAHPADTRSATEKYADLDGLKQSVRSGLRQITDGREAEVIVAELTTNEIEFLAGTLPAVIADLKPKWAMGVPAGSFIPYIRKYMRKAIETQGVEYGLQQPQIGGVGGGVITTAANLVPRNQLDDLAGNLELASLKTNVGDRAKIKLAELMGLGKTKYQGTDGGFRGREQTLAVLMKKMPNLDDRRAIADEGSVDTLYEYDQHVNELGENMPSSNEIKSLTDAIQDAIENDRYEDLDDYLLDLEGLLDGIDWELLDVVYDTAQTARQILRGELSAPQLKQEQQIRSIRPNLRDLERVQDFESIDPFAGEELLARPRQAFGQEIAPEQEESNLPSAYAMPQMPQQRPINDPFEGDRFAGSEFLTAEEFQTLTPKEKRKLIIRYDRDGGFDPYPELSPEIQKITIGGDVDEDELDYLYGHYLVLTGNDTGDLDLMEPMEEAPQPMGRPQFQEESGLRFAEQEEDPLTDPNAGDGGLSSFYALPRDRKISIFKDIADAEGGRTRRGDYVKNQLLFIRANTPTSKLNSIMDTFDSIDVDIPSESISLEEDVGFEPAAEKASQIYTETSSKKDRPPRPKASASSPPDSMEEFQNIDLDVRREILKGLVGVPKQLGKDIAKLADKARDTTVDRLYERYLYYKQSGEENPDLSQSAMSLLPSTASKKGGESTSSTQLGSSAKSGASNAPTEELFAQPSIGEKSKVEFHYPKTNTEFKGLEVADKRKIIDRTIRDDIYEAERYTDTDDKDYDQSTADKVEAIVKSFQGKDPSLMSGEVLNDIYKTILPFIKEGQATGRVGFGLPAPHHIIGTHGYGLKKTHTMPDGLIMTGAKHTSKSKKKGNIIFGMGLATASSFPKSEAKVRLEHKNIDFTKGITAEPTYVPFGTHLLNKHKLKDNIVMLRTKKGGAIQNIETQKVSGKLSKVLHTICGGSIPQFESVMDLADNDKALLHRITKTTKVSDRLSVPNPNKSKMEEEDNRFNILRGEVALNNDNPAVIKEFKVLLLKFMNERRVPIGQGRAILEEMLMLGY